MPQKKAVAADKNLSCIALVWIFVFSMKKCTRKSTTQSYLVKNMVSLGRLIPIFSHDMVFPHVFRMDPLTETHRENDFVGDPGKELNPI